ncbi:MAG TPA: DUF6655 family protein [Tepidisphaeraceae bacterium]
MPGRALLFILVCLAGGCASIRVTDPARSATEQFLMSQAVEKAVGLLSVDALRDRVVYVDAQFLPNTQDRGSDGDLFYQKNQEYLFLAAEVRAKLLGSGVRLAEDRNGAQIVIELRSQGVGIDRTEFLLGLPSVVLSEAAGSSAVPVATPELSIVKRTTQKGFAAVAFVAYWKQTGELVAQSGPTSGKTSRQDYWFFGIGPSTVGNILPTEPGD